MKQFRRVLTYLRDFKINIVLIFFFNLCYAIFSVFSLSMVAPFLSVLFGNGATITERPDFSLNANDILNTFYYQLRKQWQRQTSQRLRQQRRRS